MLDAIIVCIYNVAEAFFTPEGAALADGIPGTGDSLQIERRYGGELTIPCNGKPAFIKTTQQADWSAQALDRIPGKDA